LLSLGGDEHVEATGKKSFSLAALRESRWGTELERPPMEERWERNQRRPKERLLESQIRFPSSA
jgi:hypothetical protein